MYHCVYSPPVKRIINSSLDSIELIKSELSIVKNDSRIYKKCGEKCKKRRLKVKVVQISSCSRFSSTNVESLRTALLSIRFKFGFPSNQVSTDLQRPCPFRWSCSNADRDSSGRRTPSRENCGQHKFG